MKKSESISLEKKLDHFMRICKQHGIKLTPQRLIIYEELVRGSDHPSTDMLYQQVKRQFPTISFDTVHRTLLTFKEIGVAEIIEGTGNPKRFDGNMNRHHHFQCISCKRIFDIYDECYNNLPLPREIPGHFQVFRQSVRLEGLCGECR